MHSRDKKILIILGLVIIILFVVVIYLGFPIGVECGYFGFLGNPQKDCECFGIKTGGCMPGATCDGASYGCIGICQNCVCKEINPNSGEFNDIPCE